MPITFADCALYPFTAINITVSMTTCWALWVLLANHWTWVGGGGGGGGFEDPPDTDTYEETELRLKSSRTSYSKSNVLYSELHWIQNFKLQALGN